MNSLLLKGIKNLSKGISLFVALTFLSTSTLTSSPFANSVVQPQNLAVSSPMVVPPEPEYRFEIPTEIDPQIEASVKEQIQEVLSFTTGASEEDIITAVASSLSIYASDSNLPRISFLAFLALADHFGWDLDEADLNTFYGSFSQRFRKHSAPTRSLVAFMILSLFLPFLYGCMSTRPVSPYPDITRAASDVDLSRLLRYATEDPDSGRRLSAVQQINHLLNEEKDKNASERTLAVMNILRGYADRLPNETNAEVRQALITGLGIVLFLKRGDTQARQVLNEVFRNVYLIYYQNLRDIARFSASTDREDIEKKNNREAENRVIVTSLSVAGRPFSFSSKVDFVTGLASLPARQQTPAVIATITAVKAELAAAVEGTLVDGVRTYTFTSRDISALNALYTSDAFSSLTPAAGKINRLAILNALASLESVETIPTFLTALDQDNAYKGAALRALLAIGTLENSNTEHNFGTQRDAVATKARAIVVLPASVDNLRDLAAQILILVQDPQVAGQLRAYVSGQANLTNLTPLASTYAKSVIASSNLNAAQKAEHGAQLIRIVQLTANNASGSRLLAAQALQHIGHTPAINALLGAKGRVVLPTGNSLSPAQTTLKANLEAEIAAINAALTALGFTGDYNSLKTRALDRLAPMDLRVAMLRTLDENFRANPRLEGFSADTAPVSSDIAPIISLTGTANDRLVLGGIRLLGSVPLARISPVVRTQLLGKISDSNSAIRVAAVDLIREKQIPLTDVAVTAVVNNITSQTPGEITARLNLLLQATRSSDAAQRTLVSGTNVKTELETIAQATSNSDALRDLAVTILLAIEGPTVAKPRLQVLSGMARAGSAIKAELDALIQKADWNPIQTNFYGLVQPLSGDELATFLNAQVPTRLNGAPIISVLNFVIQERARLARSTAAQDQVSAALALVRLGDVSQFPLLTRELNGTVLSVSQKRVVQTALVTFLNNSSTTESIRLAALASDIPVILNAALGSETSPVTFTATAYPVLRTVIDNNRLSFEVRVVAVERLAAAGSRDAADQTRVNRLSTDLRTAQGVAANVKTNLGARLLQALIQMSSTAPRSGGDIGRGDQAVIDIWNAGPTITNEAIQAQVQAAVSLALETLEAASFTEGLPQDLADIAKRRLTETISIEALPVHVEAKSTDKSADLFFLGRGEASIVKLSIALFEDNSDNAQLNLARAITHELLEGARKEILGKHPAIKKQLASNPEALHRVIIDSLEAVAFTEADLGESLKRIIETTLQKNAKLDALKVSELTTEAITTASVTLADKALEEGSSEEAVQAGLAAAFLEEDVTLSETVAAHLVLPGDVISPLSSAVLPVLDSDAVIVLDAAVLETEPKLSEALTKAIANGRVLFFGEPTGSVSTDAFVQTAGALSSKVSELKRATQVVTLLTPTQMRAHFNEYGLTQLGDAQNFVAPLNTSYDLPVHLALASELLSINFDLSKLSDAAKLLLALEIDSLGLEIGDMRSILTALGQIPSEIIREGKKRLQEDLIGAALKRIAA